MHYAYYKLLSINVLCEFQNFYLISHIRISGNIRNIPKGGAGMAQEATYLQPDTDAENRNILSYFKTIIHFLLLLLNILFWEEKNTIPYITLTKICYERYIYKVSKIKYYI